ncbi:hypothetical protein [Alteromonas sp. AMM-1]|uniref:hypothetical protein n=1 Tax=Alteromonas sp. AMM-1 TaxID=3394233 RepID=UPI0039A474F6
MANQPWIRSDVTGQSHAQLASIFSEYNSARSAIGDVIQKTDLTAQQITVVTPHDGQFNRLLESESKALGKMMLYSRLILGGAGLLIGVAIAYMLVAFGPHFAQAHSLGISIAAISPCVFIGLFVAGLLRLRPDETEIIDVVREAIRNKQCAVIINLRDGQSLERMRKVFAQHSERVVLSRS